MTTTELVNLKVNGNIISSSFPAALGQYRDVFNRIKVSNPYTIFNSNMIYIKDPRWEELTTGTGTATISGPSGGMLTLTTQNSKKIVRQTRRYFPYIPGRTQAFNMTGVLHASDAPTGSIFRMGSYDDADDKAGTAPDINEGNGHFFEANNTTGTMTYYIVQRSSIGGSITDTKIARSDWNLDKLDGTGPSTILIDFTKTQIYVIERAWLGVGVSRLGIAVSGLVFWAHQFLNENTISTTYMARATLPIRYELNALGVTSGTATMTQICSDCYIENGFDIKSLGASYSFRTIQPALNSGDNFVFALRPSANYPRALIMPSKISCVFQGAGALTTIIVKLWINPVLTGTSYSSVSSNSLAEYTTTGTISSSGTLMDCSILGASGGTISLNFNQNYTLACNIAGTTTDIFMLTMEVLYGSSGCAGIATLTWNEIA